MSSIERVIIFRALKLGDMLCSIPAIRGVRNAFPSAHIALAGHPQMGLLFSRYKHYIDEFIPFAGFPGMPESPPNPLGVWETIRDIQNKRFDMAIQLHGSGELSNPLISLFNAKSSIGHYRQGHYRPEQGFFKLYPENTHEIDRCLSLLDVIGVDSKDRTLEFSLIDEDFSLLQSDLSFSKNLKTKPYICLHPGASSASKCWSPQNFALLADWLSEKGVDVVFTGSSLESPLIDNIRSLMKCQSYEVASNNLSLGPLGALIKKSSGLICNDTGVSHLAAALKVSSIVLFIQTDPDRWAPLNKKLHQWLMNPSVEEVRKIAQEFLLKEMAL